jgi:hypothetical protein
MDLRQTDITRPQTADIALVKRALTQLANDPQLIAFTKEEAAHGQELQDVMKEAEQKGVEWQELPQGWAYMEAMNRLAERIDKYLLALVRARGTPVAQLVRMVRSQPIDDVMNKFFLNMLNNEAHRIRRLLGGEQVVLPVERSRVGQLRGGRLRETMLPGKAHADGGIDFMGLLREHPFPLGLCACCHNIFVQQGKGRPQRFCSAPCRMKRAAGQRAKEMREYRRKKREHDLQIVKNVLRDYPQAQWRQQLQAEFTHKKHGYKNQRQLGMLISQALTDRD